ncbi:MAG: hypothetical protein P8Z00_20850 [Anaerolineales bacterium]|jgi:hypothetical protein
MRPCILRSLLLAGLLSGLIACQAATPGGERPTSPPPPAPARPTNAPSGLTGVVLSASDVTGQPDEPLPDQMLLALPAAEAGAILGLGEQELTPVRLRFLKADLPQAGPSMTVAVSGSSGRYTLLLEPGAYVLCVAESQVSPPDFPVTTRGCGLTTVLPGQLRRVDVSSGFGEILLIER